MHVRDGRFVRLLLFLSLIPLGHAAFCPVPALASGRVIHVATSGDDGGSGTIDRPLRTIQRAASSARPGDTILVRAGVYAEHVSIGTNGTATHPVNMRPFRSEVVVIGDGITVGGSHINISGFVIERSTPLENYHGVVDFRDASECTATTLSISGGTSLAFTGTTKNCTATSIKGTGGGAPMFWVTSSRNAVLDSSFEIIGESYFKGTANRIERCRIVGSRNGRDCYYLAGNGDPSPASKDCVVRDSVFCGFNRPDGSDAHADIFQWFGADVQNLLVENNSFGSAYMVVGTGGSDPQNAVFQISAERPTTGPITIRNNLILGGHFFVSVNAAMSPNQPIDNLRIVNNYVRATNTVSTGAQTYESCTGWVIQNNIWDGVAGIDGRCSQTRTQDHNLFMGEDVPAWEGPASATTGLSRSQIFVNPALTRATNYGVDADWRPKDPVVEMGASGAHAATHDKAGARRVAPPSVGAYEYLGEPPPPRSADTAPPEVTSAGRTGASSARELPVRAAVVPDSGSAVGCAGRGPAGSPLRWARTALYSTRSDASFGAAGNRAMQVRAVDAAASRPSPGSWSGVMSLPRTARFGISAVRASSDLTSQRSVRVFMARSESSA
jgi:hypothetical protein